MSDTDDRETEEVPEGMVRRTRRVRKKRRTKKSAQESKDHADTLFAKAKDLLVGMEDENDDHGHVDLAEQVRRLKKKKEDDRPLDDVWGTKRRSSSWLWIVLIGMIVSVVAIILAVTKLISDDPRSSTVAENFDPEVGKVEQTDMSAGPLGWFNENSVQVLEDVKKIVALANSAEDSEDFAGFVRDSPLRGIEELEPELWGQNCLTNATSRFKWQPKVVNSSEGAGEKKRGFLKVTGTRVDGNPFEAYFVKVDDKMTLDWDATTGWSEMSVTEIAQQKPRKEMFLRCRVTKKPSYDLEFRNTKYSGYLLSGEETDDFSQAYVPLQKERGKIIDRDLRLLLNYGSFVTNQPPLENQKATIRVRYDSTTGKEGVFEIVEFLHDGWVSP